MKEKKGQPGPRPVDKTPKATPAPKTKASPRKATTFNGDPMFFGKPISHWVEVASENIGLKAQGEAYKKALAVSFGREPNQPLHAYITDLQEAIYSASGIRGYLRLRLLMKKVQRAARIAAEMAEESRLAREAREAADKLGAELRQGAGPIPAGFHPPADGKGLES